MNVVSSASDTRNASANAPLPLNNSRTRIILVLRRPQEYQLRGTSRVASAALGVLAVAPQFGRLALFFAVLAAVLSPRAALGDDAVARGVCAFCGISHDALPREVYAHSYPRADRQHRRRRARSALSLLNLRDEEFLQLFVREPELRRFLQRLVR